MNKKIAFLLTYYKAKNTRECWDLNEISGLLDEGRAPRTQSDKWIFGLLVGGKVPQTQKVKRILPPTP